MAPCASCSLWHPSSLPPFPLYTAYADITVCALGPHVPDFTATVFTPVAPIYRNELWAFVLLMLTVPSRTLCCGEQT